MDSLYAAAWSCLAATTAEDKIALTHAIQQAWQAQRLTRGRSNEPEPLLPPFPGRPERPELVPPKRLQQRGLGTPYGRAALLHAIAHIEFNAINLAWDAVYRFRSMPDAYYADWIGVACDEARHFRLLEGRLRELGYAYGDFPAHNGLWEMALKTHRDPLERMALVPRVLEARGLDVTPGMISRLTAAGDLPSARILELILREEVAHVAAGSRWFHWLCAHREIEPEACFLRLVSEYAPGSVRGPHNCKDRLAAGFNQSELEALARIGAA